MAVMFTNPTAQTLIDGAWVASTGTAPLVSNELDFQKTVFAAITAGGGTPSPTAPADFNVAYALSFNTTFITNISKIAGFSTGNATQFIQALSTAISGSAIAIPAELNGFVSWLNATPTVGTAANGNGWAGIASIFMESLLGTIGQADLANGGLTADQITFFNNQHQAAVNRATIGQTFAADQNTTAGAGLSGDSFNSLILQGLDGTAQSLANANAQLQAVLATGNPNNVTGQALTIMLTTGIDTPPAFSTSVANATFFAPDVFQAGTPTPTLNAGDNLVDTAANSTATLSVLATQGLLTFHNYNNFTTSGIPNLQIQNSDSFGIAFDGSGMSGLKDIFSLNAAAGATTTLNNIPNKVGLHVTGAVDQLTLNYTNAVTGDQVLALTNATSFGNEAAGTGTDILFGLNAPVSLAVTLTGSSIVNITDDVLTTIKVTSTDAGGTNNLNFDSDFNTISSANFSAVTGDLTVSFEQDSLANGANILLGTKDTLTIGNSTGSHALDLVQVSGPSGVYSIFAGNQNDVIHPGLHGPGDVFTFVNVNAGALVQVFENNLVTDSLRFSIAGFNGGTPSTNPTAPLLAFGDFFAPSNATIATQGPVIANFYPAVAPVTTNTGQNLIVDTKIAPYASAATLLATDLTANFVVFSAAAHPAGSILIAYQGPDGVHIAQENVTAAQITTAPVAGTTIHDVVDLVGQSIANFNATTVSHMSLVA